MAVEIKGKYLGDLKGELTHCPSGAVIETDAPVGKKKSIYLVRIR